MSEWVKVEDMPLAGGIPHWSTDGPVYYMWLHGHMVPARTVRIVDSTHQYLSAYGRPEVLCELRTDERLLSKFYGQLYWHPVQNL